MSHDEIIDSTGTNNSKGQVMRMAKRLDEEKERQKQATARNTNSENKIKLNISLEDCLRMGRRRRRSDAVISVTVCNGCAQWTRKWICKEKADAEEKKIILTVFVAS